MNTSPKGIHVTRKYKYPYSAILTASAVGSGLTAGKKKVMISQDTKNPKTMDTVQTMMRLNANEFISSPYCISLVKVNFTCHRTWLQEIM
jgi:hypothetical protein